MSFDLNLFAGKLTQCRSNLQLSENEVSASIGVTLNRLNDLETGVAIPTGDEILIFADYYRQDYQFFISNETKTALDQVKILYRKHGEAFSKADRWAIQEFLFLCECEQLITDLKQKQADRFNYHPQGNYYIGHGVDGAKALRQFLGLRTNNLILDPYRTLRRLGIHIFRRKLENSDISGLFILHPKAGKCILVNFEEDIYRQNFTLAHEFGHALFDTGEEINISFSKWNKDDLKEKRANAFASAFLIPEEELIKRKNIVWNQEIILKYATELKVNIQPLVYAVKSAGIINDDQLKDLVKYKVPISEKIDPELIGLSVRRYQVKSGLLEKGLSEHYVRHCYSAYEDSLISAQRLAEMLLVSEHELSVLLTLYNLDLNYDD